MVGEIGWLALSIAAMSRDRAKPARALFKPIQGHLCEAKSFWGEGVVGNVSGRSRWDERATAQTEVCLTREIDRGESVPLGGRAAGWAEIEIMIAITSNDLEPGHPAVCPGAESQRPIYT